MRVLKTVLVLSALVGTAACDRPARPAADDLSWLDTLNVQTPAMQTAQVVSPVELGMVHAPHDATAEAVNASYEEETPAVEEKKTESRSTSTRRTRRSSGSSAGSSSGRYEGSTSSAPRARVVTVKHTKRDAAIGAVAGGVIGAVAGGPRHRVKGAVIGAAVGGITGAVIGNNVDKTRRVVYDQ